MSRNLIAKAEVLLIILLACVPLLIRFPYRVNIFLSWEGAYRISQGQLPFRDFGTPLGGMYWVIPAFFFKVLGPKLITLIKAQVFINIISGLSFRSILNSLSVNKGIRFASVLLFCMSYSFFNFWPWYNHSVIVYELIGLAFLFKYISGTIGTSEHSGTGVGPDPGSRHKGSHNRYAFAWLIASAVFICFSFLTKQDGGGMAFGIACVILGCHCLFEKKWKPLVLFAMSFAGLLFLIMLAFSKYGFGYWFNHGQAPHAARISLPDIMNELLWGSEWIKFYFFFTGVLVIARFFPGGRQGDTGKQAFRNRSGQAWAVLMSNKKDCFLLILTWVILGEAAIFQVTSYTPPDNNIFYHSFAFACIFSLLVPVLPVNFGRARLLLVLATGVLFWWSSTYWKYIQRITDRAFAHREKVQHPAGSAITGSSSKGNATAGGASSYGYQETSPTGENVVNKHTYMISRDTAREIPMDQWIECGLPAFDKIYMPPPTAAGIHRLLDMKLVKEGKGGLRVLNMSELTPLAAEMPYTLEKNSELPLWFHLGVGMFNHQADLYENRVAVHYYDLVLFEFVPNLNNFYPFRVRDSLRLHYRQIDSFMAPRRGDTQGTIEVYIKPPDSLLSVLPK